MVRKNRRLGTPAPEQSKPPTFRDQLALYRDVLDAVLKTGAVSLPIPAILIYNYLRLISHTDLFAPSTLSLAGLSALLQAFLILWGSLTISIIIPSIIVCMFLSGTADKLPAKGLPTFILLSSVILAAFYAAIGYSSNETTLSTWQFWATSIGSLIAIWIALSVIAWWSPAWMNVVPRSPSKIDWPLHLSEQKNRVIAFLQSISTRRASRCVAVSTAIIGAGIYAIYPIFTASKLSDSFGSPLHGWKAAILFFITILISFLPGAFYLKTRSDNGSHGKALKGALLIIVAVTYIALLNGISAQPVALIAMRTMGVIDNNERTYEILKSDERPVYQSLGYKPRTSDRFVQAFVRFQFGDVKLVCPKMFPFLDTHSPSNNRNPDELEAESAPVLSKSKSNNIDSKGCLTPTKDEIRVIDLPDQFSVPSSQPVASATTASPKHGDKNNHDQHRHIGKPHHTATSACLRH
ncbi:hypothetical protein [Burkholderia sp. LMG 21824]|uniref:hypothetical protein n=1 Tax=Burkholderia sp. LMG 21824 TaxID=3158172 RepID=UPI003C2F7C65